MKNKNIEYRNLEIQTNNDEDLIIEGRAIVFGKETWIGDDEFGFYESIDKNALNDTDLSDVPLRYNHDSNKLILARTRNKSLDLKVDGDGLLITAKLKNEITSHKDIYNSIKSGLITGMSFGFSVDDGNQEIRRDEQGKIHRVIKKIKKLYDVSVVDEPAYNDTSIYCRSIDMIKNEIENEETTRRLIEIEKLKIKIKLGL